MSTRAKGNQPKKNSTSTPNWLFASINKKWSLVLVFFLVDEIVTKYTTKASKPKRTNNIGMILFDNVTSKSIVEVATYNHKEGIDELDLSNFEVTCMDLGVINHETKEHWVEASTKQIVLQSQKDGIEKKNIKA